MDYISRITKLEGQAKIFKSNPRFILENALRDIKKLEAFYKDKEYRDVLRSAERFSPDRSELQYVYRIEQKVKEKLGLPENSIIKYEKVKCSKSCEHKTHYYYYAYIWDYNSKKLKKKYIGKQLPLPVVDEYSSFIHS